MLSSSSFLVVEDDTAFARTVRRQLERFGQVHCAASCAEARTMMPTVDRWDGWVFDVLLPDGNGLELLGELRGEGLRIPTLVLTAHLDPSFVRRAQELCATYLVKPLERANAEAFVHCCLRRARRSSVDAIVDSLPATAPLSRREREVLILRAKGMSRDEIAATLGVDKKTISTFVKRMLPKLGFRRLEAAVGHVHEQLLGSPETW